MSQPKHNALHYNAVRAIVPLMDDDIEQLMQCWGRNILLWQRIMRPILEQNDVTPADKRILYGLFKAGSITKTDLAEKVILEGSSLTRSLQRLAKQGMLICNSLDADRRCVLLKLTPQGNDKVKKIKHQAYLAFKSALRSSAEDVRTTFKVMNELNCNWASTIKEE